MQFSFEQTVRVADALAGSGLGEDISVHGWVRTKRSSKSVTFVELNDGSCMNSLQVIFAEDTMVPAPEIERMQTGASLEVTGKLAESPGGRQTLELQAAHARVLGEAPADRYPLQKKRHSFEYLREIAHLRARTNTFGAIARLRNTLSMAVHRFFQEYGFYYLHTPIITASDAEGAGELFQVTTLPLDELAAEQREIDYAEDFFGRRAYLTVSGQLNAEIYACALERVYTFGPTFRAENSNTSRHLAEFWMIEPEMAFCDLDGNIEIAERFLRALIEAALREATEDMQFFDKRIQPGLIAELERLLAAEFARMTYTEAIDALRRSGRTFEYTPSWGSDLQSEHERYLTEELYNGPVIVTDYPKEIKAFYMKLNDDGKTVRAMDVLVPHLGEIIGGSQREDDLELLKQRIGEAGLDPRAYWWYLDLRRFGSVPHSGFGLGFERVVRYISGMQNIRDVIPFPRAVRSAEF